MDIAVPASNIDSSAGFGELLRAWRGARKLSQLALSQLTGVSSRHLSYMETGRANPSREMVLQLARALEIPLRERNALLRAAGFAAIYSSTPLDAPSLGPVRDAIKVLLDATEPNPTFVVNRRYDVLDANAAAQWIVRTFTSDLTSFALPYNIARLLVSPRGFRPQVENWAEIAQSVLERLRRELGGAHDRDARDDAILNEIAPALAELGEPSDPIEAAPLLVGVKLKRAALRLNLFTTIATLGTPLDVTLQELRIETLFPADAESKQLLLTRA